MTALKPIASPACQGTKLGNLSEIVTDEKDHRKHESPPDHGMVYLRIRKTLRFFLFLMRRLGHGITYDIVKSITSYILSD